MGPVVSEQAPPGREPALEMLPINPASLGPPQGYSNGMLAPVGSRLLFVAGQVGWDENQAIVDGGFAEQFAQALANIVTVVREAGGEPSDLGSLTIYVVDTREYLATLKDVGAAYRRIMGRHYPAMALVAVRGLVEPGARVEIQGLAAIPQDVPK